MHGDQIMLYNECIAMWHVTWHLRGMDLITLIITRSPKLNQAHYYDRLWLASKVVYQGVLWVLVQCVATSSWLQQHFYQHSSVDTIFLNVRADACLPGDLIALFTYLTGQTPLTVLLADRKFRFPLNALCTLLKTWINILSRVDRL